eukprot:Gb_35396 [translate_table: standard]
MGTSFGEEIQILTMKKLNHYTKALPFSEYNPRSNSCIKLWNHKRLCVGDHRNATDFRCNKYTMANYLRTEKTAVFQEDPNLYNSWLQDCISMESIGEGKQVHARIIKTGFEKDTFMQNNLINMYAKCKGFVYARKVFDNIPELNLFSWTTLIAAYAQHDCAKEALRVFLQMGRAGVKPNQFTFGSVLKACSGIAAVEEGKQIHSQIIKNKLESDASVGSALVGMYAKCESIECAHHVFDKINEQNLVSWTAMIAGYVQHGFDEVAIKLFCEMQQAGMEPNHYTFTSVFRACASFEGFQQGKQIHALSIKTRFDSHIFVGNSLVDMYAKCRTIKDARQVFDKLVDRDVVSWNAIIAGYAQKGQGDEALHLFCKMIRIGMKPDGTTLCNILQPCASIEALELGKQIHAHVIISGFESDIFVGTALFSTYAKCGSIQDARYLFDKMPDLDTVSWDAMLSGYAQYRQGKEALKLFEQMQWEGFKPTHNTFVSVLCACASPEALELGKQVHAYVIKVEFDSNVFVETALVDMYAKCSSIEDARMVFDKMPKQDVVPWNAMMAGYDQQGCGEEALQLCKIMQQAGMKPDRFTFASILSVCATLALLEQGNQVHSHIIKTGFGSDDFVGNALLDMYAKCGSIENACKIFDNMLDRDVVSWTAMIVGYAQHGHGKEALQHFDQMQRVGVKPNHITFLGVLSACSRVGFLDQGHHYFDSMSQNYGITPRMDHYACMVDLFGRAGCLEEAEDFINRMPFKPDAVVWKTLLAACRTHCNIELGEHAAACVFELKPQDEATYVLLSNIYAMAGRWDEATKMRKLMKGRAVRKEPGCSWIEIRNTVNTFMAGNISHPQSEDIYVKLETLTKQMKEAGYVPNTNFVLHDLEVD